MRASRRRHHCLEARILAQGIRSGSTLAWCRKPRANFASTGSSMSSAACVSFQVHTEGACKIVPHVQVVGIDQQGASHALLGPVRLPERREGISAVTRNCPVVGVVRERSFSTRERELRRTPGALRVANGRVTGEQHASRIDVRLHERHGFLEKANGVRQLLSPEAELSEPKRIQQRERPREPFRRPPPPRPRARPRPPGRARATAAPRRPARAAAAVVAWCDSNASSRLNRLRASKVPPWP